jgi:hypothetical protein
LREKTHLTEALDRIHNIAITLRPSLLQQAALKWRLKVGGLEFHHPEIRVTFHLALYVGIGGRLIDWLGPATAEPSGSPLRVTYLT